MRNTKFISAVCIASLVLCSLSGCKKEAENKTSEETQKSINEIDSVMQGLESTNLLSHSDKAGKEETVYVLMDANGAKNDTIVSEWLKNPSGVETLTDTSTLEDIEVVKGNATYVSTDGNNISWLADGQDVYYQGRTDKELPVDVKVSYKLDGTPVDASALNNVTGHVTIQYDYENKIYKALDINGEKVNIYQPFTMMTGLLLDDKKVANVEVTDGKVVNSGDYSIVFGVAMPGLSESLGIDKLDEDKKKDINIPESVTIEADVVDFTMPMAMTVVTNNALSTLSLDKFDSFDNLKEKSGKLEDGMNQLVDGAGKLDDGMHELSKGTSDLSDGTGELNDGAIKLNDGANELVNGATDLSDGAYKLRDGAYSLRDGAYTLSGGTNELNNGAGKLYEGTSSLYEGTVKLEDGLKTLNGKTPELATGVSQLKAGAESLSTGLGQITANNDSLNSGAQSVHDGLGTINANLSSDEMQYKLGAMKQGSSAVSAALQSIDAGANSIVNAKQNPELDLPSSDDINAIKGNLQTLAEGGDADALAALTLISKYEALISGMQDGAAQIAGGLEGDEGLIAKYGTLDAGVQQIATALDKNNEQGITAGIGKLYAGSESLQGGISQYTAGVSQVEAGAGQLKTGMTALNEKVPELTAGVSQLLTGASQLSSGSGELKNGAKDLCDGTQKLANGASELASGSNDLANGTATLADGSVKLKDGTVELAGGTSDLKDGTSKLNDGVADLVSGVSELVDGSGKLKDGVIELNDDGISKIVDLVKNDLENYYDRLCAVRDFADEYTSFTSIDKNSDNTVKFIYKIDGVE